ncbi:hypothetical protein F5884DRAFT_378414 [Xylogone sp. PMI_703]|nr:hypothetical protein F5884DRAFT_378414 [Xylogone sp. PMI_703]
MTNSIVIPKLTHAFDLNISGSAGFPTSASEHSSLCVAHVDQGEIVSSDGSTTLQLVYGADWMTVYPTYATIDARVSLVSPAGSEKQLNLDIRYLGKIHFSTEVLGLFSGKRKSLDFGESYYYTAPQLESRSQELEWVNRTVFLSMGRLQYDEEGKVIATYRIFKVGESN